MTKTPAELAAIQMTVSRNGRAVMNPAYVDAFGKRGTRTAEQQANFEAVHAFNRARVGVGSSWNS